MRRHLLVLLATVAATTGVAATACRTGTEPDRNLLDARLRWQTRGPSSYTYVVSRGCFCLPESVGPVEVTVRAGVVESRRYATTGAAVPARYAELFPTVEGLFARIDSARAARAARLDVEYDPTLGYPTRIDVDFDERLADEEVYWRAGELRAR